MFRVPSSEFQVPSAKCRVPSSRNREPGTENRKAAHVVRLLFVALAAVLAAVPWALGGEAPPAPEPRQPPRGIEPAEPVYVPDLRPRVRLPKEAMQSTIAAIGNESLKIDARINAIALAGSLQLREALPALVTVLRRQDVIDVKVAAIWALGEIGEPLVMPVLLQLHQDASGPTPGLRYDKKISFSDSGGELTLIELIEYVIGHVAEPVLSQYLKLLSAPSETYGTQATNAGDRQRAALAVIVCVGDRDQRSVNALRDVVKSPDGAYPPDFRDTAALGLARILFARAKEFEKLRARDKVGDEIIEALTDLIVRMEPSRTREYIASALTQARPTTAVTLLTRHFADGSPEDVRRRTIEVLGLLRSRESVEALVWALENEKGPELRWRAAFGLGLSGKSDASIKALEKAAADPEPAVKRAAVEALARLDPKRVVTYASPRLKDPNETVRAAAARALGQSGDKAAVTPLLAAAKDESVIVRATAIAALGGLPGRESFAAIAGAARDPERQVRFTAMEVLSNIPDPAAYTVLFDLLGDVDRKIRADAGNALRIAGARHPAEFKKALIRVIADRKSKASADACDFADFADDAGVVKALKAATLDERPAVRASAIRMLDRMGGR